MCFASETMEIVEEAVQQAQFETERKIIKGTSMLFACCFAVGTVMHLALFWIDGVFYDSLGVAFCFAIFLLLLCIIQNVDELTFEQWRNNKAKDG
jgi:hypothetical protein